jgi:hypothetical protein
MKTVVAQRGGRGLSESGPISHPASRRAGIPVEQGRMQLRPQVRGLLVQEFDSGRVV